jgi:predicted phosphodiesterase
MKLALISDIHANLPALEAVLADIDRQRPDAVYCLGDLVSYAPWPNEVIGLIRHHRIPTIMGNHDDDLSRLADGQPLPDVPPDAKKWASAQSLAFTHAQLGADERAYLADLPRHLRLEWATATGLSDLLLVHGSPASLTEYVLDSRTDEELQTLLDKAGADLLLCGHSHVPFHRPLPARLPQQPLYRHVVNTGSVGKPKDGDPRAGYVLLTGTGGAVEVTMVRVAYDVERVARAIEQSPLPDEFADRLRRAY